MSAEKIDPGTVRESLINDQRRRLLRLGGVSTLGLMVQAGAHAAPLYVPPTEVDTGGVSEGKIRFPEWGSPADKPTPPPPDPLAPVERVGVAVVGLGRLALGQILPAFAQSKSTRLAALVSGSPEKMRIAAAQYGVPSTSCHSYSDFDRLRDDPAVQIVYVVLPNAMHREYVERAAAAGKHVLCEKPMATSVADARAMTAACARAGVKLMVAYRCQYEPNHRRIQALVRGGTLGKLVTMSAHNVQAVAENAPRQWRHKKAMAGGGSLVDIGLYCLNAARFVSGEEPVEVSAITIQPAADPRFAEVEETINFHLRFPSGFTASAVASYGAREHRSQTLLLEKASLQLEHAYDYEGQRLAVGRREGDDAADDHLELAHKNQFSLELDHLADCIRHDRKPRTPGEEGVQDHILMEALYKSAATGRTVSLAPVAGVDTTRGPLPASS
jgi:predicted dehydrogenase